MCNSYEGIQIYTTVLSVLQFTASDYLFGIVKLFLSSFVQINS